MKQENKELLFKDLCARLPYGVKVTWDGKHPLTVTPHIYCAIISEDNINNLPKIFLRPLSSMTEEERSVLSLCDAFFEPRSIELKIDFYNEQYLDYRGLIEKGLALEAPEGMYDLKKK